MRIVCHECNVEGRAVTGDAEAASFRAIDVEETPVRAVTLLVIGSLHSTVLEYFVSQALLLFLCVEDPCFGLDDNVSVCGCFVSIVTVS
jgi:hypothetical protein